MKAALLVNPRSGRMSGRGLALAERLDGVKTDVAVLERFDSLPAVLRRFAETGIDTLFVSAGDGTLQAIQTELAERKPFPTLPRLAILPHGTTNLTANELGIKERNLERLTRLIVDPVALSPVTRPTLRIANPRDGIVRHGMFFGAGAIPRASAFCQQRLHAMGLKGDVANLAALAASILGWLRRPSGGERIAEAFPMRVATEHGLLAEGDQLLFLATTLKRLILGSRPFWGGEHGPIRATAVAYPPPSVARWLIPILYGGEARKAPPGCVSVAARRLELETTSRLLLDGEFFDAPLSGPLRIETGPDFTYLRGLT